MAPLAPTDRPRCTKVEAAAAATRWWLGPICSPVMRGIGKGRIGEGGQMRKRGGKGEIGCQEGDMMRVVRGRIGGG